MERVSLLSRRLEPAERVGLNYDEDHGGGR